MTTFPTFTAVSRALTSLASLGTAAESHGLLCALLSFNNKIRESAWVDSLLATHIEGNDTEAQKAYQCLTALFQETLKAFNDESRFDFPILIPEDDLPIEDRIDGLAEWCQGYLTGLHLMGLKLDEPIESGDLKEAIDDLLAISQIELTAEDAKDPAAEVRFMEVLEHVKAAVLVIQTELKERLEHRENLTIH